MKEHGFHPQEPLSTADWLAATKEAGTIRKLVEGLDLESRRREQFESMMRIMDKVSGFQLSAGSSYPLSDFVTYSNPESSLVLDIWDQPQAHPDEPNLQVRRLTIPNPTSDYSTQAVEIFDFHRSDTFVRTRPEDPGFIEWEPNPELDSVGHATAPTLEELRRQLSQLTQ